MKSKSTARSEMAKTYDVKEVLPNSFAIAWIFIVDNALINKYQAQQIGKLYSKSLPIKKDLVMNFNPLLHCAQDFLKRWKQIKDQNRIIKLVADPKNAQLILSYLKKQKEIDNLSQLYVFSPDKQFDKIVVKLKEQFPSLIKVRQRIDQIISVASEEIEKWRIKFQILRNMLPLSSTSQETAFQWRIRFRACSNLKHEKFDQQLDIFNEYVSDQIESKRLWDGKYQNTASSKRSEIIKSLRNSMNKLRQIKKQPTQEEKEKNAQLQDQFAEQMLKLYKDQTFFYEILNEGLRKFVRKSFEWEKLSLPICLMFKAIKLSYQKQEKQLGQSKSKEKSFIVWRGGKISQRQLEEIKTNWEKTPFYEFFSFVSTSKDINVAVNFLKSAQKQAKKFNCLFKFIVKRKSGQVSAAHEEFFNHGYCSFSKSIDKNEKEILLNALTVGKIIRVEEISWESLKNDYKCSSNNIPKGSEAFSKIPLIIVEIGSFEELFINNNEVASTMLEQRRRTEEKAKHKSLIEHYLYTIDIIKKYQDFDFADAYELCNQMEKSYRYLLNEIDQMVEFQKNKISKNNQQLIETNTNQKSNINPQKTSQNKEKSKNSNPMLNFIYAQSNYYSRLSDICRKMGKLSEALVYNDNAIGKVKQLQNIDKNRSYNLYQEKLNKMYLKSSQLLIQNHQYSQASQKIESRIQELQKISDERQRQRNKVIISRLLLDLGVTNFKQGKLKEAEKIFADSAQKIEHIYEYVNYDYLNEETHFFAWLKEGLSNLSVLFEGPEAFYKKKRAENIAAVTAVYGGEERLRQIKKSARSLQLETSQVIINHKEYFCDAKEYEKLINEIQEKIVVKLKNQQNIPEEIFFNKNKSQLSNEEQAQLLKSIAEKQIGNKYQRMKEQMNQQLIYETKQNLKEIMDQQKNILNKKEEIDNLRQTFWDNPNIYLDRVDEFKQQFGDLYIKKQELNREKLLILQSNDQITMEELTEYYKKSAASINSYIKELQRWGYSQSAPKILQQYNNLIKLYIQINYKDDAEKKIEEVKRFADIKGEEKYYEMAVAYLLNGKIYEAAAEIDSLIIFQQSNRYKYDQMKKTRKQKVILALKQFDIAQSNFKNALIKSTDKQNLDAYEAEPQQVELKIWKVKCFLIQFELSQDESEKNGIHAMINELLGSIFSGLKKIKTINNAQLKADSLETQAIYLFQRKQFKKSLDSFEECIQTRIQKLGALNWQNMLTYIKVIFMFYMVDSLQQKLQSYIEALQKNYMRYKNYPFYWKVCLAQYYVNKQRENHKVQETINFLENALIFMEKIGFAEEHFYHQYELIYDFQYTQFYNDKKPFLNHRPKLIRRQRKLKPCENQEKQENNLDEILDFSENQMLQSVIRKKSSNKIPQPNKTNIFSSTMSNMYLPQISSKSKKITLSLISSNKSGIESSRSEKKDESLDMLIHSHTQYHGSGIKSGMTTNQSSGISKHENSKIGGNTIIKGAQNHSRIHRRNNSFYVKKQ